MILSLFISAFGQSFVLKGIVSSADGELLPGVNVKIQGTTVGTITDIDGNFQLNVNKGAVLEFSYIGFKKQSIKVNSQQMLNVELALIKQIWMKSLSLVMVRLSV